MTDVNDSKMISESFEIAKKDLRSIVGRIEEMGLGNSSLKLLHAHSVLKPRRSKFRKRYLWILMFLAWVLGQFLWNYVLADPYDKVDYEY